MGEDSTAFGGAIRDMWTPTCYGDPGKVSDAEYFCDTDDGGGVHSNSGVPNHAYALIVDGGTLQRPDHHRHRAHQGRGDLLPGDDGVPDADHRLRRPRRRARGVVRRPGRASRQRAEHRRRRQLGVSTRRSRRRTARPFDAVAAAVELRQEPTQCNFQPMFDQNPPALCGAGHHEPDVFSEDFEDGLDGWDADERGRVPRCQRLARGSPTPTLPEGPGPAPAAYGPAPDQGQCDGSAEDFSSSDSIISPVINIPSGEPVAPQAVVRPLRRDRARLRRRQRQVPRQRRASGRSSRPRPTPSTRPTSSPPRPRATPTRWPASRASPAPTVARSPAPGARPRSTCRRWASRAGQASGSASTSAATAAAASTAGTSTTSRSRLRHGEGAGRDDRRRGGSEELTRGAPDRRIG